MATAEQIASLRLMIDQPEDEAPYDDLALGPRIDAATSLEALAKQIWLEKAASYADLVSVAESGSSRQLSDLHKNALAMAKGFGDADPTAPGAPGPSGVRMRKLTRR